MSEPPVVTAGLRVLVAEDNRVNQLVVAHLLRRRGHSVTVVENGREALAALDRAPFDVVLMDVQMPEMSGLEATAVIRERERTTGACLPIIAVTAHAMKGDRERCLAAGMTNYLSKPIDPAALERALQGLAAPAPAARLPMSTESSPVFDEGALMARIGGDERMFDEAIEMLREDCPALVAKLGRAVDVGDAAGVRTTAHTIKGLVANFGAAAAVDLARRLETQARENDLGQAGELTARLQREADRLVEALMRRKQRISSCASSLPTTTA